MGAVANMQPDLFRAIHSAVPFVDVMNTIGGSMEGPFFAENVVKETYESLTFAPKIEKRGGTLRTMLNTYKRLAILMAVALL